MMTRTELEKSIELLTSDLMYFKTFGWYEFTNRGNCCTGRLDRYSDDNEKLKFELFLSEVRAAVPRKSDLYYYVSEAFRTYFGETYVRYDFATKLLARALESVSSVDELKGYIKLSLNYRIKQEAQSLRMLDVVA